MATVSPHNAPRNNAEAQKRGMQYDRFGDLRDGNGSVVTDRHGSTIHKGNTGISTRK